MLVLPKQVLQVSWKPSEDAGRSAIEYIVNTTTVGMDYINSTSVKHPITSVPISGLPQYSSGTVSVWAKNPGALSQPVVLRFRMVNIITNGKRNYMYIIACNQGTTYIGIVCRQPGCACTHSKEVSIADYLFPPPTTALSAMVIFDYSKRHNIHSSRANGLYMDIVHCVALAIGCYVPIYVHGHSNCTSSCILQYFRDKINELTQQSINQSINQSDVQLFSSVGGRLKYRKIINNVAVIIS